MRRLTVLAALALLAIIAPATASGRPVVDQPAGFSTTGTEIAGWSWLRAPGASAQWQFTAAGVQAARPGSVYLLFSPLVTNRANGGSGYGRSIKVTLRNNNGKSVNRTVSLSNPFRPVVPEDSNGIGYQTYGSTNVPSSIWKGASQISARFEWRSGYHVAVQRDTVRLSYRILAR